ncbi:MAG: threonine aldolase family protein [Planctomycetota bacterium]|jgi:threonine aldolase
MPRTFRSDNNAGLCPEALAAIAAANDGHVTAYGDDPSTDEAEQAFRRVLGEDVRTWLVATGTAANTLAIAALTEAWEQVLCHEHSHYNDDESTAPERLTGCRAVPLATPSSKLTPEDVGRAAGRSRGDVHQPQPGVLTISNLTEFGTVYTPEEIRALCDAAHAAGYRVHVDGARFANAVAALGCDPRELAGGAGVDALSFGGTKNGLAFGEAVCFFPQGDGAAYRRATATFDFHRKSTGHLLSKHRFVSAPFAATLRDGTWLRHAAHANAMGRRDSRSRRTARSSCCPRSSTPVSARRGTSATRSVIPTGACSGSCAASTRSRRTSTDCSRTSPRCRERSARAERAAGALPKTRARSCARRRAVRSDRNAACAGALGRRAR